MPIPPSEVVARPVVASVDELIAGADRIEAFVPSDGRSFVPMRRVEIDGLSYVAKTLSLHDSWIARATGEVVPRVLTCWQQGILDALPDCLDHTIVAVAHDDATQTTTLLMRDVGDYFVPDGDDAIGLEQHHRFLDHMAAMHAAFRDRASALPVLSAMTTRYMGLGPLTVEAERSAGRDNPVVSAIDSGWQILLAKRPDEAKLLHSLALDPWPLVAALSATPSTFVHGDWKLSNLGTGADLRTILVDWQFPGVAQFTYDIAWYLAINAGRLPEPKLAAIESYRSALERYGVDTAGWFEPQLALSLLGGLVQLCWDKANDDEELDWWLRHGMEPARDLL
jgi:hypothetical protein